MVEPVSLVSQQWVYFRRSAEMAGMLCDAAFVIFFGLADIADGITFSDFYPRIGADENNARCQSRQTMTGTA